MRVQVYEENLDMLRVAGNAADVREDLVPTRRQNWTMISQSRRIITE